ncbi:hypothetical protein [Acidiphilium sp. JA12-A1]|uniref:hypothetical protein n=1 Tax=Acidiphilium sp. JA12-A1 TaxID=1464546 RepID=UPI000461856D|nr:hypothetical protein [Acidiphilium sp. JA12-A1]KDM66494.1 hypothetical protein ACIDI_60c00010 [Acidiphilium sp. JA12-A1]
MNSTTPRLAVSGLHKRFGGLIVRGAKGWVTRVRLGQQANDRAGGGNEEIVADTG